MIGIWFIEVSHEKPICFLFRNTCEWYMETPRYRGYVVRATIFVFICVRLNKLSTLLLLLPVSYAEKSKNLIRTE